MVVDRAEVVSKLGCPVLMVTARAHGDSEGRFNDIGWSARLDLQAACEWIRNICRANRSC